MRVPRNGDKGRRKAGPALPRALATRAGRWKEFPLRHSNRLEQKTRMSPLIGAHVPEGRADNDG
jgi:hypothetical protein